MNVRTFVAAVQFVRNHPVAAAKLAQRSGAGAAGGGAPEDAGAPPAAVPNGNKDSGGGGIKTGNEIGFDG